MHKTIEFESNIRYLTTPLTRSTIFTVKKLAMDPLGRILMLRISPRANTPLFETWPTLLKFQGRRIFALEKTRVPRAQVTPRIIRLFPMRGTFLVEYFRRVTWRDTRVSAACFRLRGIIQISTALSRRIYRRKLGPVQFGWKGAVLTFKLLVIAPYCVRSKIELVMRRKRLEDLKQFRYSKGFFFKSAEREGKRNVRDRTLCFSSLNI